LQKKRGKLWNLEGLKPETKTESKIRIIRNQTSQSQSYSFHQKMAWLHSQLPLF
jgi:hypothetical protein